MTAHINIGSNLGDSRAIIEAAVAGLFALSAGECRRSSFVESEPWGFDSPNPFLNIGIDIESDLTPTELLHAIQEVERRVAAQFGADNTHRNTDGTYRDRAIDIDPILYGDVAVNTPELTLPHPRMHLRPFVLAPLRELGYDIRPEGGGRQRIGVIMMRRAALSMFTVPRRPSTDCPSKSGAR